MKKLKMLLADDERNTRDALERFFRIRFDITLAEDGVTAINLLNRNDYDLVLTDLRMPGADGFGVLDAALGKENPPSCIVFSAYGSIESAVEAVKRGAFDFVTKPVNLDRLEIVIDHALEARRLKAENHDLKRKLTGNFDFDSLVAKSQAMHEVLETVKQIAPSRSTVLITGESGTGKEVIARAIHALSGRPGPLVPVHCAALPANLLESELFGHEKGAFTGAIEQKKGRFELAENGTLFLDEIGEIEPQIQVKLLRVLESRTFERVGGIEEIHCDARLISATNRDLEAMVREGEFREDLYYRLDVVSIKMPPLRERREDIPILTKKFIDEFARDNNRGNMTITESAMEALQNYSWPGNIRELRNSIERMVVLSRSDVLDVVNLPSAIGRNHLIPQALSRENSITGQKDGTENGAIESDFPASVLDLASNRKVLLLKALEECGGNRTKAAKKLGISRRTLYRYLEEMQQR